MIYIIRRQKVMLDSDLAALYGVTTKRLNEQVRRNIKRFPADFMFRLTAEEGHSLRSQFATLETGRGKHRKYLPMVFTENGVAMLSGVLNSDRAISVNISIMRTFTNFRQLLASDESLSAKIENIEKGANQLFKIVFKRLDALEAEIPLLPPNRRKIGI